MTPSTEFAVKDSYEYLDGLGNYLQSEAFPGANTRVNNSPQKPPYGLKTERISGSSFTAPRDQNLQTWIYRATPSLFHEEYTPYDDSKTPKAPSYLSPNSYMWPTFPTESGADWISSQKLLARNGDPSAKSGLAIWTFSTTESMKPNTAFSSIDGDCLIIPQSGALDIQTELGKLLVRQNEICVIPRGIRYRVTLPAGPAHGYICELCESHFQIPALGIVGSTGLANARDFQIPTAFFDGTLDGDVARANNTNDWTLVTRQAARLWHCTQDHTPFDVAAWHGTNYPFKYDLAKFCVLGNVLFDEHDPCLYTVLTAPAHGEPGNAVVDFLIVPPRYMASEGTLWLPYYHRNTMNEFYMPIINSQDENHPFNQGRGQGFKPFGAGLNGSMVVHGATEEDLEKASNAPTTPAKTMTDGITIGLFETERPLYISDWAEQMAVKNMNGKRAAKVKGDSRL